MIYFDFVIKSVDDDNHYNFSTLSVKKKNIADIIHLSKNYQNSIYSI